MPELFKNKEDCCGCTACLSACPKNAIQMVEDEKGYLYPTIDKNLCIGCNICEKVCPLKIENNKLSFTQAAYGVKNKDNEERNRSSSGSVFIEIAKAVLSENGVVFGVEMDSNFIVYHSWANTLEESRKFQGSKYVQSIKGNAYSKVKEYLMDGKKVLFTGTPCEVAGLKKYLGKDYNNLLTIDIICHGVPSQKLLQKFINKKEKDFKSKIKSLTFRDKKFGWRNQEIHINFENDKDYHAPIWEDEFYRLFTSNYILRESCYVCHFANMNRPGDITIGDFWNIKNVKEDFEDTLGISSILVNTEKGADLFDSIKSDFNYFNCDFNEITQPNLQHPSIKPENFEEFKKDFESQGLDYCLKKYGEMGVMEKVKRFLSPLTKRVKKLMRRK